MRIPIAMWWRRLNRLPDEPNQDWRDHFMLAGLVDGELVVMQTVERRFWFDPYDRIWCTEHRLKDPAPTQAPPSDRKAAEPPSQGAVILPFAPVDRGRRRKDEARLSPRDPEALRRSIAVFAAEPERAEEPTFRPSA